MSSYREKFDSDMTSMILPQQQQLPQAQSQLPSIQSEKVIAELVKGYSNIAVSSAAVIPAIMQEQRNNVNAIFNTVDWMEEKGMITVNRPMVVQEEDNNTWREKLVGYAFWTAIVIIIVVL